jgi:hypothetical protein
MIGDVEATMNVEVDVGFRLSLKEGDDPQPIDLSSTDKEADEPAGS